VRPSPNSQKIGSKEIEKKKPRREVKNEHKSTPYQKPKKIEAVVETPLTEKLQKETKQGERRQEKNTVQG